MNWIVAALLVRLLALGLDSTAQVSDGTSGQPPAIALDGTSGQPPKLMGFDGTSGQPPK
jgi:hypothetical protein